MSDKSYESVEVFHDSDGVSAEITRRKNRNGVDQYSFRLYREYESNGEVRRTTWMQPRHIPAMQRLAKQVNERLPAPTHRRGGGLSVGVI